MKTNNNDTIKSFKENEELYKSLNKSLERKIHAKDEEIKNVESHYDKKIFQAKENGEVDFQLALDRNNERVQDESRQTEEKLKHYQSEILKANEAVSKNEQKIKNEEKLKVSNLKAQFEESFQDQYQNALENQRQMQAMTQNSTMDISAKAKSEKMLLTNQTQAEINALTTDFTNETNNTELKYKNELDRNFKNHNIEMNKQRDDLKKISQDDFEKNTRLNAEKNKVNQAQSNFQEKYQQSLLLQKDQDFKVRYEKIVREHDDILKGLSERLDSDVKKMVESTSMRKKIISDKVDDPFYRVEKLDYEMVEAPDHVLVKIPIAEYEKDNVQLSTQGRGVKLTVSRKYNNSTIAQDGIIDKSTRSELYSKEFRAKDILDPKSISQSYSDGLLQFKIKKA